MFPSAPPQETVRFEGNKINCFPRDQSLSVYYVCSVRAFVKVNVFKKVGNATEVSGKSFHFIVSKM